MAFQMSYLSDLGLTHAKCRSCDQDITSPVPPLACKHTYCSSCIHKVETSDGKSFLCPECSKGLISDLSALARFRSFQSPIGFGSITNGAVLKDCQSCGQKVAELVARCYSCNHDLCPDCKSNHSQMSYLASHRVVPLGMTPTSDMLTGASGSVGMRVSPPARQPLGLNGFVGLQQPGGLLDGVMSMSEQRLRCFANSVDSMCSHNQQQFDLCLSTIEEAHRKFSKLLDEKKHQCVKELDRAFREKQIMLVKISHEIATAYNNLSLFESNGGEQEDIERLIQMWRRQFQVETQRFDASFRSDETAMVTALNNSFGDLNLGLRPWNTSHSSPLNLMNYGVSVSSLDGALAAAFSSRSSSPRDVFSQANVTVGNGAVPDIFATADMFVSDESKHSSGKSTPTRLVVPRSKVQPAHVIEGDGSEEGKFNEPSGVAFDSTTGELLVADGNNHRVMVFTKLGSQWKCTRRIGAIGKHDGALAYPNRVAICPRSGNVVITERQPTHQVKVFSKLGTFLRKFGADVLQNPRALTIDNKGNVIVVESKVHNVFIFDQNTGAVLHSFSVADINFPTDVSVNESCDKLYISDNGNNCVKIFNYSGVLQQEVFGTGYTSYPMGVHVTDGGTVVVVDNHTNFNVTVFESNGSLKAAFESSEKHQKCNDVAFADDGTLVLACQDKKVYVYQFG